MWITQHPFSKCQYTFTKPLCTCFMWTELKEPSNARLNHFPIEADVVHFWLLKHWMVIFFLAFLQQWVLLEEDRAVFWPCSVITCYSQVHKSVPVLICKRFVNITLMCHYNHFHSHTWDSWKTVVRKPWRVATVGLSHLLAVTWKKYRNFVGNNNSHSFFILVTPLMKKCQGSLFANFKKMKWNAFFSCDHVQNVFALCVKQATHFTS